MTDYSELLMPRMGRVTQDASFARRTGAFLIDALLLDLILAAPFAPLFAGLLARAEAGDIATFAYTTRELAAMVVLFLLAYAYFVLFEYVLTQTVGMMLMRIQVKEGGKLWQHALRNSLFLPFFPFMLFWVIEPIAILFSRRGVLERLSGTRTLHEQRVQI